ncbi:MAG: hypothetical protein KC613_04080, partial [Myxococcales bacterium]|nr:hypothetical protein [Myxococcales bacterium]
MSDEGKKSGPRDLSDLRARLGMLNKGPASRPPGPAAPVASNPFAPKPTPALGPIDLQADPDAELGADTAIVRIGPPPEATPAPAPVAAPIPAPPAPAPAAPAGLDL